MPRTDPADISRDQSRGGDPLPVPWLGADMPARWRTYTAGVEYVPSGRRRFPVRAPGRGMSPAQSLVLGFTFLTLAGAFLLQLPISSRAGATQPFVDALFMASSGITTTGLGVVDLGTYYSLFGQIVLLVLFQIGGLGYMVYIAFLASLVGRRLSPGAHATLLESIAGLSAKEHRAFVVSVFWYTFLIEALCTVALGLYWMRDFPVGRAFYLGLFHSISAFSTAGFSLFPDSFMSYRDSAVVNVTIAVGTIAGAVGFFVLRDLSAWSSRWYHGVRPRRLSVHTRLVLVVSAALAIGGSALVLGAEWSGMPGARLSQRLWAAMFQVLSASTTTGFNSVDVGAMAAASQFALILLMFIGASPGGTGGGIKTTTFATVLVSVKSLLSGAEDAVVFLRRIPEDTVRRALAIGLLATALVVMDTLVLTLTERQTFLSLLFEVSSAFGTAGLSMGITAKLSVAGKIIISLTMLIGRAGPLMLGFALLAKPRATRFRYADEEVFVG